MNTRERNVDKAVKLIRRRKRFFVQLSEALDELIRMARNGEI